MNSEVLRLPITHPQTENDTFYFQSKSKFDVLTDEERKKLIDKINVFPNSFFEWENPREHLAVYEEYITFSNLPVEVDIYIYSLSGVLIRSLNEADKRDFNSPFKIGI